MAATGRGARQKGTVYERKICKVLGRWMKCGFHRVPNSGGLNWGNKRSICADIICDDPAWNFVIECKNREDWTFESLFDTKGRWLEHYWEQCTRDTEKTKEETGRVYRPMVIFSRNHAPNFVVIRRQDFMKLDTSMPVLLVKEKAIFSLCDMIQIDKQIFLGAFNDKGDMAY